jgi:IS4 transposase
VLKVGPWVAGRRLLFDLGFFSYGLFARLSAHGGYFVSRLKARANPTIVAVHRVHRGRARDLVGKPLADVLPRLQREVRDVEVELSFKRRRYRGRRRTDTLRLRLVGLREATSGEYPLYLTHIPPKKLPAEDLSRTYALRWVIELLFKELKSSYRLDEIPSRKSAVVEALLYAALLTFVASRRLLQVLHEALAEDLILLVLRPAHETRALAQRLSTLLLHEAPDPNVQRLSLLEAVETRAHTYRPRNTTARAPMPASSC